MAKRSIKKSFISPSSSDSFPLFIIGAIVSGFAFGVGGNIAAAVIKRLEAKVETHVNRARAMY